MFLSAAPVDQDYTGLVENYNPAIRSQWKQNGFLTPSQAGDPVEIAVNYLRRNAGKFGVTPADFNGVRVTSSYADSGSGLTHVYLRQMVNGLEVTNANANVHIRSDGRILSANVAFVSGLAGQLAGQRIAPTLTASQALSLVGDQVGIKTTKATAAGRVAGIDRHSTLRNTDLSAQEIPTRLQYVATENGSATLGWKMILDLPTGDHWYELTADARTGEIINAADYVAHASYNVLQSPTAHPYDPSEATSPNRTLVTDPQIPSASPFGWHDNNGVAGAEFTTTQGNNVHAYIDRDGTSNVPDPGSSPDGGAGLNFDFPLDLTLAPTGYQPAAVTNLFYWNNLIHDVTYKFGFTEAAGNFQTNNYGLGGAGNDYVQAEAQDGSGTNNANFGTPADGSRPRMQMYLWSAPTPDRDGDLDNRIIVHEYTHGISNRLTGGPANVNALNSTQSGGMGEGWGDFLSLLFTQDPSDAQNGAYGVGTYALGEPNTGNGVRRFPYSFDTTIDPLSFDAYGSGTATLLDGSTLSKSTQVHNSGELWCTTLWDLNWLLINKYGYATDLSTGYDAGSGNDEGNLLAFRLVMDGMKLQPANPSFIQARDAILQADQNLTGGVNFREIWTAFARRGLGAGASTSSASSSTLVTSFSLPAALIDPFVTSSTPTNNANSANAPISSISLTFAEPMNPSSFSVVDDILSFTGPGGTDLLGSITGSSWTTSTTLKIDFAPQRTNGTYNFVLGPSVQAADDAENLDQDGDGTPGEAVDDRFNLSFTKSGAVGPRVTGHTPTGSLSFVSLTQFDLTFSEAMDQSSFALADVQSFTGPGGADLLGQITGSSWANSTTLRVNVSPQSANGTYTLVLGPQVLAALDSAAMDQNADGIAAGAGDTYSAAVTLDRYPGPEGFGYEMNAYPFENIDLVIGQPGVNILVNGSDDTAGQINLGTSTLNYYGTTYTGVASTVYANPNGLMSFGTSTTNWTNGDLTSSPSQRALAILWDDWRTDGASAPGATDSAVLYKIDGDRLIVEWSDVCNRTQSQGAVTFQAILQLNTGSTPARIIYNYVDTVHDSATYSNGASSSVGIKDTATQGPNRILLSQNNSAHPWVGSGKAILIAQDVIAPTVTADSFTFVGSHQIKFTFDEPMTGFDAADLLLHNNTTTLDVSAAVQAVSYDSGTNTATFTVPGLLYQMLEDGDYTATLSGVTDVSGNPLDGDEDFLAGGNYSTSLFFLNGDADRDRDVDSDDFNILAANFGFSPRDFTQGDFTNDGQVDSDDFNELAGRFGVSLGAGGAVQRSGSAILPPVSSLVVSPSPLRSGSPFGDELIASLRDSGDDALLA